MPFVIVAAAAAAVSAAVSGAAIGAIIASTLIAAGVALLNSFLAGKPKQPRAPPGLSQIAQDRTHQVRSSTLPYRIGYGEIVVSGNVVVAEVTDNNTYLHYGLALLDHRVWEITDVWFNDTVLGARDGSGNVTEGRFADHVRIKTHLGGQAQVADADLVSEVGAWTSTDRLRGKAWIYARLKWSRDVFPTGIPNIKVRLKARMIYDPRETGITITGSAIGTPGVITTATDHGFAAGDPVWIKDHAGSAPALAKEYEIGTVPATDQLTLLGPPDDARRPAAGAGEALEITTGGTGGTVTAMKWDPNWANCVRDWLASEWGFNLPDRQLPDAVYIAAANASDEGVALKGTETMAFSATGGVLTASGDVERFQTGDTVRLTGGSLPTPFVIDTDYFWIDTRIGDGSREFALATTLTDARAGTGIAVTSTGSGTAARTEQPRYDCNGLVELDGEPGGILEDMITAGFGAIDFTSGQYRLHAGTYPTETFTIDKYDLHSQVRLRPRTERRELYNQVAATFVDPFADWAPTEAPIRTNALYQGQDGEPIRRDLDLGFTTDRTRAQRICEAALRDSRQALHLDLLTNMRPVNIAVWDTGAVTLDRYGFAAKKFRCMGVARDLPGGCVIQIKETAPEIYDWDAGDALDYDPAPDTNLPDPTVVANPTGFAVTTESFQTETGTTLYRLRPEWTMAADAFVTAGGQYEIQWKASAEVAWRPSFFVDGGLEDVVIPDPVQFGVNHDLRIRSVNSRGVKPATWQSIFGYTAGAAGAGATAQYDDGLVTEIPTEIIDMGSVTATPTLELDDGSVT